MGWLHSEVSPHPGTRFYGVMVSTQDSESCDPSSNLGRTCFPVSLRVTVGSLVFESNLDELPYC